MPLSTNSSVCDPILAQMRSDMESATTGAQANSIFDQAIKDIEDAITAASSGTAELPAATGLLDGTASPVTKGPGGGISVI